MGGPTCRKIIVYKRNSVPSNQNCEGSIYRLIENVTLIQGYLKDEGSENNFEVLISKHGGKK